MSLQADGVEQIVIWDNSADGGKSARILGETIRNDPGVNLCVSEINLGFAAGVNHGLAYCGVHFPDRWVLLINNDARVTLGTTQKLSDALLTLPDAKLAFPSVDHAGKLLGRAYYNRLLGLLSWTPRFGYFPYASGCCMLVATDRVRLPLFDEAFFMYGEDCELGWRMSKMPGSGVFVEEAMVVHYGAASSGMGSEFYETRMVVAHLILARKLANSCGQAWFFLFGRAPILIARATLRSIRFRSTLPLRCLWHGAREACKLARESRG
jgi:N-acetylglucosaminyl-diphospho-decaprenol L-rhamnosyltransferase